MLIDSKQVAEIIEQHEASLLDKLRKLLGMRPPEAQLQKFRLDVADDGRFTARFPIAKRDDDKRVITGWAAISRDHAGRPVIDHQGDHIPVEDLEKAAYELVRAGGSERAGEMHERRVGDIVELMVVDAEKRAALGFGDGPEGLVVSMKIHDDAAWSAVKSGELRELSISGVGERIPVAA